MRHVSSANVEEPAEACRIGQDEGVMFLSSEFFGDGGAFGAGTFSGEGEGVNFNGRVGRIGLVFPYFVYGVWGLGDEGDRFFCQGLAEGVQACGGMEPWVVSDAGFLGELLGEPWGEEVGGIGFYFGVLELGLGLEGVSSVCEEGGVVCEDCGCACGSCEACEPCEAFV